MRLFLTDQFYDNYIITIARNNRYKLSKKGMYSNLG